MADDLTRPFIGYRSAGRRPESQQDRRAAADAPLSALRGAVSGVLGAPGDIESLIRMLPGLSEQTVLPTSEDVEKRLPMRELNQTPTGKGFTTAGQLGGGFYTGPGSPLRAVAALPSAVSRAGRDFAMASGRSVSPLTVFHGSPHKFDKFDSAKIGTGEGNQSYGHGLYLAQAPDVAKQYQKIGDVTSIGGKPVAVSGSGAFNAPDGISKDAINYLALNNWNVKSSLDDLGKAYKESDTVGDKAFYMDLIRQVKQIPQGKIESTGGNLYTVDLPDEKIAKMLDWDKGGRETYENLAKKLLNYEALALERDELFNKYPSNSMSESVKKMTEKDRQRFSEIANLIDAGEKNKYALASDYFREQGVPGIKYLDQQTRNAGQFSITPPSETVSGKWMVKGTDYNSSGMHFDTEAEAIAKLKEMNADATQNFVVFPGEEEALTILKRNNEDLQGFSKGGAIKAAAKSLGELVRKYTAPQDEALMLAQQRAALPVEQGGLGLAAGNTPAERAAAMVFDMEMPLYHGTGADIKAFDLRMSGKNDGGLWGKGQYLATAPDTASSYALREGDGANVIPAYIAAKNPMKVTTGKDLITRMPDGTNTRDLIGNNLDGAKIKETAQAAGHDSVFQVKPNGEIGDIVTFNPESIRSRFAAFDPFRRTAATAALYGVAAPDLLAAEKEPQPQICQRPGARGKGYAEGGMVTGANFPTDDFDPARIDAIVGELHAMNAA